MKAHIGVDADSRLVHTVIGTPANINNVTQAQALLHGDEKESFGDAGYQGADKRPEAHGNARWNIAMRPGKRRAQDTSSASEPSPTAGLAELCELAFGPVPKYCRRSDGCCPEPSNGGKWPNPDDKPSMHSATILRRATKDQPPVAETRN